MVILYQNVYNLNERLRAPGLKMGNAKSYCGFNRKRGYLDMLESNYADVKKFVEEKRRNECSENTIRMYIGLITEFEEQINKTFREVTERDINTFIDRKARYTKKGTMATTKMVLKAFYKWLYGLKDSYPECVAKLEVNGRKHNGNGDAIHLEAKDILTKDDVATLIKCGKDIREEAMVAVLYESGCRVGEFVNMHINDLVGDRHGRKITVTGKTGSRTLLLIESVPYLTRWLEHHPLKEQKNAPLWVKTDRPYGGLHVGHVARIIRDLAKRSGIQKPIHPHAFRHARATFLARFLSDSQMKVYFGWSPNSSMVAVYVHLSGRDNDGAVLRSAGIEETEDVAEKSPLKEKECSRCHTKNTGVAAFCQLYGRPFRENAVLPENNEIDDLLEKIKTLGELFEKVLKNPKNLTEVVSYVEDLNIRVGEEQMENEQRKQMNGKCICGAEPQGQAIKSWMLGERTKVSRFKCANGHEFNVYERSIAA
jgi:integrase/recombinase XerD